MARRHWRFVVRDRYGFTIQNALVYVYQPGTTNAFVGSAYAADAGGSPITNPFTTNQFGEVEGYFDTEQSVDVFVTDNTDTAYRAIDGSGVPISFTSFTERDEIHIEPTDDLSDAGHHVVGTATELQDITLALQAESAGSSGKWADGQHIHGHVAFSGNPHGDADHTNVTRSFFLRPQAGTLEGSVAATLAERGTEPNAILSVQCDATVNEGMFWQFEVPADWASGALQAEVYWAPSTTFTLDVKWSLFCAMLAEADLLTEAGVEDTYIVTGASEAADTLIIDPAVTLETPVAAGNLVKLAVRRLGADGADTYTGISYLVGVRITYTANQ